MEEIKYTYEVEPYIYSSFELMPPGIRKQQQWKATVYVNIPITFHILWLNITKTKKVAVYKSSGHLDRRDATMIAEAVIDVLNCNDITGLNHILYSKWGYKNHKDTNNWKEYYPQFYDEDFEPFYTQYYQNHPEDTKAKEDYEKYKEFINPDKNIEKLYIK